MNNTINTINHFIKLLTLKSRPQNLHYSILNFSILLGAFFILISYVTSQMDTADLPAQMQKIGSVITFGVILHEAVFLTILYFLLKRDDKTNRFIQVATNFVGIDLAECLLSLFIGKIALGFYVLCALKAWLLVIKLHVTRHAFDVSIARAAWLFITVSISSVIIAAMTITFFSSSV